MKWSLTLIFSILIAGAALASGPDEQFVAIYDLIQQGDSFDKNGQLPLAAEKYQDALTQLKQLQNVSPEWHKDVVAFRIDYLNEKMQKLGKYAPAPAKTAATNAEPAETVVSPQRSLEQDVVYLQQEVQQLAADKAKLEAKLKEALSAQPAAMDPQELARAQQQIAALTKERDLLSVSLEQERLKAQLVAKPTSDSDVASLRKQLAAAHQELTEVKRHSQQQTAALQSQIAQLKQANSHANAVTFTPAESEKVNALTTQRDDLKKQVDSLSKELADAEAKRDEDVLALKTELEHVRAELKQGNPSQPASTDSARVAALQQQVLQLTDRLAVLEAKPVPPTAEELAILKKADAHPSFVAKNVHKMKELPSDARLLMDEGERLAGLKEYGPAEKKFRAALKQDPQNVYVLATIANVELAQGQDKACEKTLKKTLAIDPDDAGSLYLLGRLRLRQDKVDEALDLLSRSARINPSNAATENALGNALSRKGLRQPAETALRKALEIDPDYPEAHHNLALVYATDNPPSIELAKWHYKKATDAGYPKDPDLEKLLK